MKPERPRSLFRNHLASAGFLFCTASLLAAPQGMVVRQGSATTSVSGVNLNIHVSQNTFLDWSSFNIGAGESTTFLQPSSHSVVWNQINDANPSQILGHLNANGHVVLMNQNGFYFGPDSVVNVGGFIATTATPMNPSFTGGAFWQFNGPPPAASIVNYGEIKASSGGSVFLVAEKVENHGVIMAPDGTLGLYAGKEVSISERPDGRGLSAKVSLPEGSVDNSGKLIADAGTIALHARVVNQEGLIQANSVREHNGVIELVASENIRLGASSIISAKGDSTGVSKAGNIAIKSAQSFIDDPASKIDVRGGTQGGDGGTVEISANAMPSINSHIDGTARHGWTGGNLLIDPLDIILGNSGTGTTDNGNVNVNSSSGILRLNVNSAFIGFSHITLQAQRDITLSANTIWDLNSSTQISDSGSLLTLEAGRNIVFGNNSRIVGGTGWSVQMAAGADFTEPLHVAAGGGGIYFNGAPPQSDGSYITQSGALETLDGFIDLRAGSCVLVGTGYIRTVGGGNINITTLGGDVDAGRKKDGYTFTRFGYDISPAGLGGISTARGGNININSGGDISSFIPVSGAYGDGNVTLNAGGNIFGKFQVRNGVGIINSHQDLGSALNPVSLSLIHGSWDVTATSDIYLNEVYNPNGSMNANRIASSRNIKFEFDYANDASVKLKAGHSVQLLGSSPVHTVDNPDRPPIYAPKLEIEAGAGGVILGNDLVLAPSVKGSLKISTTDGGSLKSTVGNSFQIVVSDSGSPDYTTFIDGHASTPLHLTEAGTPISMNISGNVENIRMQMPKKTVIEIGGDALNFFFTGQNLRAGDETKITIHGDFKNRSDITTIHVATAPNVSVFDPLLITDTTLGLSGKLRYDPATKKLTFIGRMSEADRNFLLHPTVFVYDPLTQKYLLDENGNRVARNVTFAPASVINDLFNKSQDVPTFPTKNGGLLIGGPGTLSVSARNMDLGITAGIRSVLAALNPSIAKTYRRGADIKLTLSGNLNMTSSQIASFNGGSIEINSLGALNIGSQEEFTSDDTPKGIYTASGGAVTVSAKKNINVNGSRIATYNGGDLSVISEEGDINVGSGSSGFIRVTTQQYNPATGQVENEIQRYFGSGILAFTAFREPGDTSPRIDVGNITLKAGRDILAGAAGIVQLDFGGGANNTELHLEDTGKPLALLGNSIFESVDFDPTHHQGLATSDRLATVEAIRDIVADAGVVAANVDVKAGRNLRGLIIAANGDANINAHNANVFALATGNLSASASGSLSGTLVAKGDVEASADSIQVSAISTGGGSTSLQGDSVGSTVGAFANVTAVAAPKASEDADKTVAEKAYVLSYGDSSDDEKQKGKGSRRPVLAKSTGRVTVILPEKAK